MLLYYIFFILNFFESIEKCTLNILFFNSGNIFLKHLILYSESDKIILACLYDFFNFHNHLLSSYGKIPE